MENSFWWELSCQADPEAAEAVAQLFTLYGHGGVALEPALLLASLEEPEIDHSQPITVRTYLPVGEEARVQRVQIEVGLKLLGQLLSIGPLRVTRRSQAAWERASRRHWRPLRIGERIIVKPIGSAVRAKPSDVVIELDPGLAFGTGAHPTTQMCLAELERRLRPDWAVLDVGTGSGILAIAAAKLGAAEVLAIDIDPVAVKAARSNAAYNCVAEVVLIQHGSLPPAEASEASLLVSEKQFDLILANLTAALIARLSATMGQLLRPGGLLIVGGILIEAAEGTRSVLSQVGLRVIGETHQDGWVTLVVTC